VLEPHLKGRQPGLSCFNRLSGCPVSPAEARCDASRAQQIKSTEVIVSFKVLRPRRFVETKIVSDLAPIIFVIAQHCRHAPRGLVLTAFVLWQTRRRRLVTCRNSEKHKIGKAC